MMAGELSLTYRSRRAKLVEAGDILQQKKDEPLADKIRLEEFRVLRGEIELRASEQRAMERNVVLLAASIYAFLLYPKKDPTDPSDMPFITLAWYLPSLFSFLALVRWRESLKMIEALAEYLKQMERDILGEKGWETFLASKRHAGHLPIVSRWYGLFWTVSCVGTLVVAYLRHPVSYKIPVMDATASDVVTAVILGIIGTTIILRLVMRRQFLGPNSSE
jgi:hypothetical protein